MKLPSHPQLASLRHAFHRRFMLLLVLSCLLASTLIAFAYKHYTDKLNRSEMAARVTYLSAQLAHQQQLQNDVAYHLINVVEWAGWDSLDAAQRNAKLNQLLNAQIITWAVDGIVIVDNDSNQRLFDFWLPGKNPQLKNSLLRKSALMLDEEHNNLYSHLAKPLRNKGCNWSVHVFKLWDQDLLSHITPPDSTTFVTLGTQTLLSSAGNLALESLQPSGHGYSEYAINHNAYQEDNIVLSDAALLGQQAVPIKLVVRNSLKNHLAFSTLLIVAMLATLLFGSLLFFILGRWLGRIGKRLDLLTHATTQINTGASQPEQARQMLDQVHNSKQDQIGFVARELSQLIASVEERKDEQNSYLQTLDLLQDAVIEISPEGKLLRASDAFKSLMGKSETNNCSIENCVHVDDSAEVMEQISGLIYDQKQQVSLRFRIRHKDEPNAHFWVEGRFAPIKQNNVVVCVRGVLRDINNSYRQERQISHMALHDALTDLPNRVLLEDRMDLAMARAQRNKQRVALGFIDLDHFKQINDNFGHKVGDQMLKEVTKLLQSVLRSTDTLSRWGGDEFVVLCPDINRLEDAREITHKLAQLTRKTISIDGTDFPFTFSAGFAVYPDDASNNEMLMSQADRAMFYAKAQGRNNIQFFNEIAAKEKGRTSFYIQSRLAIAIQNNDIQINFQPMICSRTGIIIGAEVLARWHESEQGWIPPSVFIPMAESLGLIERLGNTVWQQALQAMPQLPETHRLSINLSKRQLFSNQIVEQFHSDVVRAKISPARIMFEITESLALSDVEYARERILELHQKGFGIAVDDFGVGYSSLSQLHEIPASELKLDKSFVQRVHEKSGHSMITAMLTIARSLNLQSVAEGVEDSETAAVLTEMGVDILQGYHHGKPMPVNDYLDWLQQH